MTPALRWIATVSDALTGLNWLNQTYRHGLLAPAQSALWAEPQSMRQQGKLPPHLLPLTQLDLP